MLIENIPDVKRYPADSIDRRFPYNYNFHCLCFFEIRYDKASHVIAYMVKHS